MPGKVIEMANLLEPPAEFIEKRLTDIVNAKLEQFCIDLSIARAVWHQCPALVESPDFPEPFRSFHAKMTGSDPSDDDCDPFDLWVYPCFQVDGIFSIELFRESFREEARADAVRVWPRVRHIYPKLLQQMPDELAKISILALALLSEDASSGGPAAS